MIPVASKHLRRRIGRPGPPPVPFVLAVGVTGHRADVLPGGQRADAARRAFATSLERIEQSGRELAAMRSATASRRRPPRLRFVSPIADGADQIAAEVALELGWELQAILPFERARLSRQPRQSRRPRAVRRAARAGRPACSSCRATATTALDAYVMTGRATVAHCDMLIAVWDGLPPRGRGGTGEVVQLALTRGTAIIHVPLAPGGDTRILWSAFDPTVVTVADDPGVARPLERARRRRAAARAADAAARRAGAAIPPRASSPSGCGAFAPAIEYPLLLTRRRRPPIPRARLHRPNMPKRRSATNGARYRAGCAEAHNISAPIDLLEEAYSWADRLATHFAQTYRSGHIFNFVLGGFAVCLGLAAFMAPHLKFEEAAFELLITFAIILNAQIGTRQQWHRRWLDYRQLAERLRPMRSLKLLGIAAPDPPGTETNPVPQALDRLVCERHLARDGLPVGDRSTEPARRGSARPSPSMRSSRRSAITSATPSRSTCSTSGSSRSAWCCSSATLLVSVATLIGLGFGSDFVNRYGNWFTLVSAGFPALGTAVFGIRFQADFGGDAVRSMATADTLRQIDSELRKDVSSVARRRPCRAGGADHAVRPRRVAAGQPAARPVGRLALHEAGDGVDGGRCPPEATGRHRWRDSQPGRRSSTSLSTWFIAGISTRRAFG